MLRKLNNARPAYVLATLYAIAIPMIYARMGITGIYFLIGITITSLVFHTLTSRKSWE